MDLTGLPAFTDGVANYLAGARSLSTVVVLGWREHMQQVNAGDGTANRIVITPGDDMGNAGTLGPPREAGYGLRTVWPPRTLAESVAQADDIQARALSDWAENATVYVWAVDVTAPEDERLQYIAARALLQEFRRAAQYVARISAEVGRVRWVNIDGVERQYGREIEIELVLHSPILDVSDDLDHPTVGTLTGSFDH